VWKWNRPPSTHGSTFDQQERLIRALEEQNALMRLQLEMAGVRVTRPIPRPDPTMLRKRTASDVTRVTSEMIAEEARKRSEQEALPADAQTDSPS
jgi:hypothetical protein